MPQLRFEWDGRGAKRAGKAKAVEVLRACLLAIVKEAKQSLSVPGTGREGTKRGVSAPGEPPRKQTGRLRASVTWELDEEALVGRAGTNVLYGMFLELGTKRGIAPRPWLRPAALKMRGFIDSMLATLSPD